MLNARTTLAQRLVPRTGALAQPLVRDGLLAIAGTALLALCARISFPLPTTPVPVTMQTFAVLLLGALYGPRLGAITMVLYLAEGLAGLPVFAGGRSAWSPSSIPALPVIVSQLLSYDLGLAEVFEHLPAFAELAQHRPQFEANLEGLLQRGPALRQCLKNRERLLKTGSGVLEP